MMKSKNIYRPELVKLMREDLRPFIESGNSPCLADADLKDALKALEADVRTVYIGLEKDIKGSLLPLCERILSLIQLKFKSLKAKEFTLCCTNGLMGDYGQAKIININMFGSWIKEYCISAKRMEAFKEYFSIEGQLVNEVKLPKEEGDKIIKEGIVKAFKNYKDSNEKILSQMPKLISIYYDHLKPHVTPNEDVKAEINKEAEERLKRQKNLTQDLATEIFGKETHKTLCRRIALKRYFDKLISEGIELESIIK